MKLDFHFQNMRRVFAPIVFVVALLFTSLAPAQKANNYPELTGRVVDQAGLISALVKSQIEAQLAAHEAATGNQVAVLTIDSLKGANLEQYSLGVARQWALGEKGKDNGVLFFIAKNDRKMRIEVGYGLEGKLTDAIASFIIRNTIAPSFRSGDFSGGINKGTASILDVLATDQTGLKQWESRAKHRKNSRKRRNESFDGLAVVVLGSIWFFIFFGSAISSWLVRKLGREIKPGHYRWLGMDAGPNAPRKKRRRGSGGRYVGGSSWGSGRSSGGGFSGGGGGFGGGGSSGSW